MDHIKKIPGGWVTVLVGSAVVIYLVGNAKVNQTATTLSDDTVGRLASTFPGGFFGTLVVLASAGAFLNKETIGTIAPGV